MNEPVPIKHRDDLEQFRETYYELGGCKLIHCSRFGDTVHNKSDPFSNGNLIRFANEWLNNDDPANVNVDLNTKDESFALYSFAKFLWLAEDLRDNSPYIFPQGYINEDKNITVHPGSVKVSVLEYLGYDYEIMVWGASYMWRDIQPLTFEEWCDLIPINGTKIYVETNRLEVWTHDGFRKNIYNWYYNFNNHVKNDFKIFIGMDSTHSYSAEKCKKSIRRFNKHVPIEYINVDGLPEYTRPYDKQTTAFTYSRFLVPHLMGYEGVGLFCDDDFVWNCDPLEVLYSFDYKKAVSCVQHNFIKDLTGTKMLDKQNVMYPRKNWSSLMLFNNAHPDCANLTPEAVNTKSGQWLHRFNWTNEVGKIPHTYNWCEGSCDYCTEAREPMEKAKVWHFTRGGPWIDLFEDWSHIKLIDEWNKI